MKIEKLTLIDVRNIANASFFPAPELTVIYGKNGQGKTNLLESVWLLTGSKSFRGAKDIELVREGAPFAVIEGVTQSEQKQSEIRIVISGGERCDLPAQEAMASALKKGRTAKVNGVEYGRATNLAGVFTAVVFDPGHLSLIKGSPEGRRRFLDAALCQLYPQYLSLYRRYARLVAQKNALLKAYYTTKGANALLDVFDAELARCGTELSLRRQRYLALISPEIVKVYDEITSGSEGLTLQYEGSFPIETASVCEMQCALCTQASDAAENTVPFDALGQVLNMARPRDIAAGFCTVGPHREDFTICINGRDAKAYGSQGQQRSAVLALKLAEAAGAQAITGEHPVMLLDDVLSELDDTRQAYLLQRIAGRQTIVTACNPALFAKTQGRLYRMDDGVLREK